MVSCFERLEYSKTLGNSLTLVFPPHHEVQGRSVTEVCSGVEQRQALGYDARERDWPNGGGTTPPSSWPKMFTYGERMERVHGRES